MPRAKKIAAEAVSSEPAADIDKVDTATEPEPKVADQRVEFAVHDKHGHFVRSYSVEIHGENASELAAQYAAKIGGSVK